MREKPSWHADAHELAAQGLRATEIAQRLGRGVSTVYQVLNPEYGQRPERIAAKQAADRRYSKRRAERARAEREAHTDRDPGIPGLIPVWHKNTIVDFARVDIGDWPALRCHRFTFAAGYARAVINGRDTYLHHMLLGPVKRGSGMESDHVNQDKLDNRRANLRVVTQLENAHNRGGMYERCWWRQQLAA